MKTMTAAEAKNSFGKLLDETQRAPVVITKNDRPVAVTLSMADFKDIARSEDRGDGAEMVARLLERARIHKRIAAARQDAAQDRVRAMDKRFFEGLKKRAAKRP